MPKRKSNKIVRKGRVIKRKVTRSIKNQPLSKKIGISTKIILSCLLVYFLLLSYFLLLTYLKPRNIPLLTDKINAILYQKTGYSDIIKSSSVQFMPNGYLLISSSNVKEIDLSKQDDYISNVEIGKIFVYTPLSRLIFFNFKPSKIEIYDSKIEADYSYKILNSQDKETEKKNAFSLFYQKLQESLLKNIFITDISFNNTILHFKNVDQIHNKINIKNSSFKITKNISSISLASINNINFSTKEIDVYFKIDCKVLTKKNAEPKCNLFVQDIKADDIAIINKKFSFLEKIKASIDINLNFGIGKFGLNDVFFKISSKKGSFNYSNFFSDEITFFNLEAQGSYHAQMGAINLAKIITKLESKLEDNEKTFKDIDLEMSLLISGLNEEKSQSLIFDINLKKVLGDEIARFWPISLPRQDIRKWVKNHISKGIVDNAYTSFKLIQNKETFDLDNIEAKINFSDIDLSYSEYFPTINKINGVAHFDKGSMFIKINDGNFLDSTISKANVVIEDFFATINILQITGNTLGNSEDLLKYINHKSPSTNNIKNFINGQAQSKVIVKLPLSSNLNLSDAMIDVESNILDLSTELMSGSLQIKATKPSNSKKFTSNINLDNTKITIPALAIEKEPKINASLDFSVIVNDDNIIIDNISLAKIKDLSKFGGEVIKSEITGRIIYNLNENIVSKISLQNNNFGDNNYLFNYKNNNFFTNYSLSGTKLDLASLVKYKLPIKYSDQIRTNNYKIDIDITRALLLNQKQLDNLHININCSAGFCNQGLIKANYNKEQFLNFTISQDRQNDYSDIKGKITNISYLAEGLDITNLLENGDFDIQAKNHFIDNKNQIEGNFKSNDKITFFETKKIKDLAKNDLFSQVKDTIFNKGKTIFNDMRGEFIIKSGKIDLQSFIANNLKVGITARGKIDLKQKNFSFKGMIVPGFIINNLFGIDKIPIVGDVVSGLLTGGEKGGGLFGIRYYYSKESSINEEKFETEKIKSFIPTTIKNLFDLI